MYTVRQSVGVRKRRANISTSGGGGGRKNKNITHDLDRTHKSRYVCVYICKKANHFCSEYAHLNR